MSIHLWDKKGEKGENNYFILDEIKPEVYFTDIASRKMSIYIKENSLEVGWLGFVENPEENKFIITDVILFEQKVSSSETDISAEQLYNTYRELEKKGIENPNEKLLFWGHSHVNMSTSPSKTDEDTARLWKSLPWSIRGIFNKKGEVNLSVFFWDKSIEVKNVKWEVLPKEDTEDKVKLNNDLVRKINKIIEKTPYKIKEIVFDEDTKEQEKLEEEIKKEIDKKVEESILYTTTKIYGGYNPSYFPDIDDIYIDKNSWEIKYRHTNNTCHMLYFDTKAKNICSRSTKAIIIPKLMVENILLDKDGKPKSLLNLKKNKQKSDNFTPEDLIDLALKDESNMFKGI